MYHEFVKLSIKNPIHSLCLFGSFLGVLQLPLIEKCFFLSKTSKYQYTHGILNYVLTFRFHATLTG